MGEKCIVGMQRGKNSNLILAESESGERRKRVMYVLVLKLWFRTIETEPTDVRSHSEPCLVFHFYRSNRDYKGGQKVYTGKVGFNNPSASVMRERVYVCACVCMYVCVCVWGCVCVFVRASLHWPATK